MRAMPSIAENRRIWDEEYPWAQEGDEWSDHWGTAHAQWFGCLLPRVFPFLRGRILEIAPGHGRWTQFLYPHCESLIGIDLAQSCVERCVKRFENYPNVEFKVNDGLTFPMVVDASIDFVFSFDSLVHAESDVMSSYVKEISRVLKPGRAAFIHHSNLAAACRRSVWDKLRQRLAGVPVSREWRATSMSAERMRSFVEQSGMVCVRQELIPWGTGWPLLIDCLSTMIRGPSQPCVIDQNRSFMKEAANIKRISTLFCPQADRRSSV